MQSAPRNPRLNSSNLPRFVTSLFAVIATSLIPCASSAGAHILDEATWRVGSHTFKKVRFNWKGEDGAFIEVSHNGNRILRRQSHDVWVYTKTKSGKFEELDTPSTPLELSDLNGDGVKDFAIRQWSGGAYCCYVYEIFSLSPGCQRLFYDDAGAAHFNISQVKNHPAVLEMEDGAFLFWRAFGVDGPRPVVYLIWKKNRFELDQKRMRQSFKPWQFAALNQLPWTAETERSFIALVYAGQLDNALRLAEKLDPKSRKEFLDSFREALRKSPFHDQILRLNSES